MPQKWRFTLKYDEADFHKKYFDIVLIKPYCAVQMAGGGVHLIKCEGFVLIYFPASWPVAVRPIVKRQKRLKFA